MSSCRSRGAHAWPAVKAFAKAFAEAIAADAPDALSDPHLDCRAARPIFIDYLRNDPTSTAVGPYSTRAREGAPVATPLAWRELGPKLTPAAFTVATVPARLKKLKRDPWAEMSGLAQRLPV